MNKNKMSADKNTWSHVLIVRMSKTPNQFAFFLLKSTKISLRIYFIYSVYIFIFPASFCFSNVIVTLFGY